MRERKNRKVRKDVKKCDCNCRNNHSDGSDRSSLQPPKYHSVNLLFWIGWWKRILKCSLIARFMGPTWGPSGAGMAQVGPMLALWTLLSGVISLGLLFSRYTSLTEKKPVSNHRRFDCLFNKPIDNKEITNALHFWPFVRGIHRWILHTKTTNGKRVSTLLCPNACSYSARYNGIANTLPKGQMDFIAWCEHEKCNFKGGVQELYLVF